MWVNNYYYFEIARIATEGNLIEMNIDFSDDNDNKKFLFNKELIIENSRDDYRINPAVFS